LAGSKGAALERYLELSEIVEEEMAKSFDRDAILRVGPTTFFKGVEADLRELCINRP
jgi:hypothetical protein